MAPDTFVLKLIDHCKCPDCKKKLKKLKNLLRNIHGIYSRSIDVETGWVTISGTVDPREVIRVLEKNDIKADLLLEEIPGMENPATSLPRQLLQQFHDQNGVAQLQQFYNLSGLKQVEMTLKATFHGNDKDQTSHERDTGKSEKKIVEDDDHECSKKSRCPFCGGERGAGTSCGGAPVCHGGPYCTPGGNVHDPYYYSYNADRGRNVHDPYSSYNANYCSAAPRGGQPLEPEKQRQGIHFQSPAPVFGYEPSAPQWPGADGYHDESPSSCSMSPLVFILFGFVMFLIRFC